MPWLRKLRDTFHSQRLDRELDEEFQFHLEQRADEGISQGLSPQEARRRAALMFGNRTHFRESTRNRDVLQGLQAVLQDLRYAVRNMPRNPAFASAAVLSLALGIGANTALFSILDGLLLRSLPVHDPGRLVELQDTTVPRFNYFGYEALRSHARLLSGVAGIMYLPRNAEISERGNATQASLQIVSHDYFQTLGVNAARGRVFNSAETVAVISDRFWHSHYHASPDAIGAHFHWADWDFTIVGIAPADFRGVLLDMPADVFLPLEVAIPPESLLRTRGRVVSLIARMQPDATPAQVAAEAGALLHRTIHVQAGGTGISTIRQRIASPILLLDALVAFVLLIACSNLANLALASASARQREMAVRQAIGAGRRRLISQLLTESALLSLTGGTLALLFARWISQALLRFLPPGAVDILPNLSFRPDAHVLAFSAALIAATCLLFGLVPALRATRCVPLLGLRQSSGAGRSSSGWLGRGLVVCEVGLCTAVLLTSGLFVRTLHNLQNLDPASAPEQVVVADIPAPKGFTPADRLRAFEALRDRVAALPGVTASGFVYIRPLTGHGINLDILVAGSSETQSPLYDLISPGFLSAMGIPLLEGRDFTGRDDAGAAPVAIVNEQFARRFLPGLRAPGTHFRVAGEARDTEIVGVVKDTRWMSLREAPAPIFYRPFSQDPQPFASLTVRTSANPSALSGTLQSMARLSHPPLAVDDVLPFTELENRALFVERMIAQVSAAFGILALFISCAGLYGLLSYTVARRTREIGIRMALGASRKAVQWMVLRESASLLLVGIAVGIPAALLAIRLAASLLFGISAADPASTGAALAIMTLTALIAACIPARRAVRVDPVSALRDE